jgi:hypothetical protein
MSLSPKHVGQIEQAAASYREAFDEVRALIDQLAVRGLPEHVFALDRMDVEEIGQISKPIARAEQRRRQWRAALHAMCELAALDSAAAPHEPRAQDTLDPDTLQGLGAPEAAPPVDPSALSGLDRFISVVQYARTAGCMYVDGRFEPVLQGRR